MVAILRDSIWVRQAFLVSAKALDDTASRRRERSSAYSKYSDTTLGGNATINSPPQFTRFADPKGLGITSKRPNGLKGMGRYYSEAIDDNGVHIHLRFGTGEHNSLVGFFSHAYDAGQGKLARTGETGTGFFHTLGRLAGFITFAPLHIINFGAKVYRFFTNRPTAKFYYLRPNMALYWNSVNTICNNIAVNMGLAERPTVDDYEFKKVPDPNDPEKLIVKAVSKSNGGLSNADVVAYNKLLPDIFRGKDGGIDIYAVANRYQRLNHLANQYSKDMLQYVNTPSDLRALAVAQESKAWLDEKRIPKTTINELMKNYKDNTPLHKDFKDKELESDSFWEHFLANLRDGNQWVTFKVNNEDDASETFSNSTKTSSLADQINSVSSTAKDARHAAADGNISGDPISSMLGSVLSSAKEFMEGAVSDTPLAALSALAGSAFIDIPEHWDDSSAQMSSMSYTMELRAPYGNKVSIFTNIYVPLAMLLAGALPLSTGKASYTSPFLCELYSKGRAQTRLGIIESLSISRGKGNVGWSNENLPLGVDVSFTVKDLSTVLHMPLSDDVGFLDEDNNFTDYMNILGSLGLVEQVYATQKFKRNWRRYWASWDKWTSPGYYAADTHSTLTGAALSAMSNSVNR
jgi:hypothetical protein